MSTLKTRTAKSQILARRIAGALGGLMFGVGAALFYFDYVRPKGVGVDVYTGATIVLLGMSLRCFWEMIRGERPSVGAAEVESPDSGSKEEWNVGR